MFGFLCKSVILAPNNRRVLVEFGKYQLGSVQSILLVLPIKSFSFSSSSNSKATKKDAQEEHSFTVSYLVNSCGLSLEKAISVSKMVNFETPEKPDSVLTFLRNYGFTDTHLPKLFRVFPRILLANPERTLLPKIRYFHSIGLSKANIVEIVLSRPSILHRSLENRLIPGCDFLRSMLPGDAQVAMALKRSTGLFRTDVKKAFAPNVEALRQLGVPESLIIQTINCYCNVLAQNPDKFDKIAKEVIEMGFNPKKLVFMHAMQVFSSMTKSSLENKMEVYRRWGWSADDIQLAFKKFPICMNVSEKKISSVMDFLVNKMGFQSASIAQFPPVLGYNLEKRVIPRCSVAKVLLSKGLMKKEPSLNTLMPISEEKFLDKFVIKYQKDVPELLNVYQGETNPLELGIRS